MMDLLKAFGRGVLYVLALPFFLVALALFGVIGLGDFVFQIIKSIVFFFTGQKFFPELPEDRELRLMQENAAARANANNQATNQPFNGFQQQEPSRQNGPVVAPMEPQDRSGIEEAAFRQEEPQQDDDLVSFMNSQQTIERQPQPQEVKKSFPAKEEKEDLEQYHPRETRLMDDYEDDDSNNGVNINYDD